jgi:hypothetical protein
MLDTPAQVEEALNVVESLIAHGEVEKGVSLVRLLVRESTGYPISEQEAEDLTVRVAGRLALSGEVAAVEHAMNELTHFRNLPR